MGDFTFAKRMEPITGSAIRELLKLTAKPGMISFAGGNPGNFSLPDEEVAEIIQELLKTNGKNMLQYGPTEGYAPLVYELQKYILEEFGAEVVKDEILPVTGSSQAMDLICKAYLNPGDNVIVESPSFIGNLQCLKIYEANLIPVKSDDKGIIIEDLERLINKYNPKMLYTIPTFQNPTGISMSIDRREKIAELAAKYNMLVAEDDPYHSLRYSGENLPAIKSFDKHGKVALLGSFSKVISPGLRLGYAVGPAELIAKMTVAKQGEDVCNNQLTMVTVSRYLERYDLDEHIGHCCAAYSKKRDYMLECIDKYFDKRVTHTRPGGGIFIWCDLPEGYSGTDLWRFALEHKVACVPGSTFDVKLDPKNRGFRLNFSLPSFEEIEKGCRIMGECIREFLK